MILKKTNFKYNDNDTGSYDIVNEKGTILFSVQTAEYKGYRYYEGRGGTETYIVNVKAHFDTKGKDAHLLMYKMMEESKKEETLKKQRIFRKTDLKWKEICQQATILSKNNYKKEALKLVKNYLSHQKD